MISKNLRDIKLSLITGEFNQILFDFNSTWSNLSVINCDVHNEGKVEYIYYNSKNECIFYHDVKKELFWCNYEKYWRDFYEFDIEDYEIGQITKCLVENVLINKIDDPLKCRNLSQGGIANAIKTHIGTPFSPFKNSWTLVEDKLKKIVDKNE